MANSSLLYKYKNGNCEVSLYDDGTKIREFPDNEPPFVDYPESMDVKVTNRCNGVPDKDGNWSPCPFCHEMSLPTGDEGEIKQYKYLFSQLNPGTEIAIGGGCPITWKYVDEFLEFLDSIHLIGNMTNNAAHIKEYYDKCIDWLDRKMVMAMGISYTNKDDLNLIKDISEKYPNRIVTHLIIGVHTVEDYKLICNNVKNPKILLLGYKIFGRGQFYYKRSSIPDRLLNWRNFHYLYKNILDNNGVLSFDNLAINQLDIKSFLTDEQWNEFYMGNDGQFSMYMDLVKGEFAKSSTSEKRYKIMDYDDMKEIFRTIKEEK